MHMLFYEAVGVLLPAVLNVHCIERESYVINVEILDGMGRGSNSTDH